MHIILLVLSDNVCEHKNTILVISMLFQYFILFY